MKEATGELNTTVIVVILIGFLMAFFFSVLWPQMKGNYESESQCSKAICNCSKRNDTWNGAGLVEIDGIEYCTCHVRGSDNTFNCVYKG